MEPLTPPPSIRAKRSTGLRQLVSEPQRKSIATQTDGAMFSKLLSTRELSQSPSRGRTRTRKRTVSPLNLALASSPSRLYDSNSQAVALSPLVITPVREEEELLFQMSPIKAQPTFSLFTNEAVHRDSDVFKSSSKTGSITTAWKERGSAGQSRVRVKGRAKACAYGTVGYPFLEGPSLCKSPVRMGIPIERPARSRSRYACDLSSTQDLFDFSPCSPSSPQFMYTFPAFETNSLINARQWRARRLAAQCTSESHKLFGASTFPSSVSSHNENIPEHSLVSAFQSSSLDDDGSDTSLYSVDEKFLNALAEGQDEDEAHSMLSPPPMLPPLQPIVNRQSTKNTVDHRNRVVRSELSLHPLGQGAAELNSILARGLKSVPYRVRVHDSVLRLDNGLEVTAKDIRPSYIHYEKGSGREPARTSSKVKMRPKTPLPDCSNLPVEDTEDVLREKSALDINASHILDHVLLRKISCKE